MQTYDLFLRTVFVYFIVELGARKVVHYGVTRSPSDIWVAQQVREATPYAAVPRFLIQDNDEKYGRCFTRVAEDRQIEVLKTPVETPRANSIRERFIVGHPVLGGLHHDYRRAADRLFDPHRICDRFPYGWKFLTIRGKFH